MGKADRLNKRPDWKVNIGKNNKNKKLIEEKQICSLAEVVINEPKVDIYKRIKS